MQGSGFTRREIVCWDLNIQYRGYYKQTWIYVDTTKRGILCKYNHLDVFYYYRIIYVHVKMLDIYGYRPFPFRICISGGSSAVAVGEGEGAGGGANVRAVGAPSPQLIPNLTKVQCTYSAT